MGFAHHQLVETLSLRFLEDPACPICPICRDLLKPAMTVQTRCTHLFCQKCLDESLNHRSSCPYAMQMAACKLLPSRPIVKPFRLCRSPIQHETVLLLRDAEPNFYQLLSRMPLRCVKAEMGCTWEGELGSLHSHEETCLFTLIPCAGCLQEVGRTELSSHQSGCTKLKEKEAKEALRLKEIEAEDACLEDMRGLFAGSL